MRFTALTSMVLVVLFAIGTSVFAKPQDDKNSVSKAGVQAAVKMMRQMGGDTKGFDEIMAAMSAQLVEVLGRQFPGKDKQVREAMDSVMKVILVERKDEKEKIILQNAEIYARYFSVRELDEITAFYQTDVGKKLALKLPLIATETMKVSRVWGQGVARDIMSKFIQEADRRGLKP